METSVRKKLLLPPAAIIVIGFILGWFHLMFGFNVPLWFTYLYLVSFLYMSMMLGYLGFKGWL